MTFYLFKSLVFTMLESSSELEVFKKFFSRSPPRVLLIIKVRITLTKLWNLKIKDYLNYELLNL